MSPASSSRFFGIARGPEEIERALDLRRQVFCVEQGISEADEFDGLDSEAVHIVGCEDDNLIGTCRLLMEPPHCRLGRMAVRESSRGTGVGRRLMAASEHEARAHGARVLVVHAQCAAEAFYARCWFVPEGQTFVEDGIDHVRMRKTIIRD